MFRRLKGSCSNIIVLKNVSVVHCCTCFLVLFLSSLTFVVLLSLPACMYIHTRLYILRVYTYTNPAAYNLVMIFAENA